MKKAAASKKANGDIVIDLSEKVAGKFRAGMAGRGDFGSRPGSPRPGGFRPAGFRPGGYRPSSYGIGAYKPWWASERSSGSSFDLGKILKYPPQISTGMALSGTLLGTAVNRLTRRLVPKVIPTNSALAVDAILFGLGIIPVLAKPNALTVGVAIPGLVFLEGSITDLLLDMVGLARPQLSGSEGARPHAPQSPVEHALAAKERLAAVQRELNSRAPRAAQAAPQPAFRPGALTRVVAQPA